MRIGAIPEKGPPPGDLAAGLAERSARLGHRPAVTLHRPGSREEQGFASLAQWASKGAHLLGLDLLLEPGDRLLLAGPAGWMPAAVTAAAWWAGLTVVDDTPAEVAVVHERSEAVPDVRDVFSIGDQVDGSPRSPGEHEPWAVAVQAFPDQPPPPRAFADRPAVVLDGRVLTHEQAVAEAAALGDDGPLGAETDGRTVADWLLAVCARPLATGQPTVVVRDGATRDDARAEGVTAWR